MDFLHGYFGEKEMGIFSSSFQTSANKKKHIYVSYGNSNQQTPSQDLWISNWKFESQTDEDIIKVWFPGSEFIYNSKETKFQRNKFQRIGLHF